MLSEDDLRDIGRARWAAPLLALLMAQNGARFTEMLVALDCARDSLTSTLTHVTQCGWVVRNPGYGHPLRPEYILTAPGEAVAAACLRAQAVRDRLGLTKRDLPRWSLPVLGQLAHDWARFSDLRANLHPITPRALSLTLKQMIGGRVVDRRLEDGFPPSALYGLAPFGRELLAELQSA